MSELLDLELSQELAPVEAPPELWGRLSAVYPPRQRRSALFALPVAAVVTLVLAGALYVISRGQTPTAPYRAINPGAECVACHT